MHDMQRRAANTHLPQIRVPSEHSHPTDDPQPEQAGDSVAKGHSLGKAA